MKRYAKYKDSGISWIGEIPEHWIATRNKNFLIEKDDVVGKSNDYQLLSLTKGGVIIRDVESGKGKFPKDFESYKIVHYGDVIFCLFDVDETPRTVGLSEYNGMITGAYDVFQLQNINSEYYTYYFIAIDDQKALRPLYTGLRKVVKKDRFLSYKIAVPPLSEQKAIADFLDKKTAQINELVAAKKKQIELLKEYKQAVIAKAVTQGINPKAKMKDSGITWIGQIPEHWNIEKLGHHFIQRKEKVSDKDFAPLSVSKIGVTPQLETACKTDDGDNRKLVCKGDFVVNSRSDRKGSCGYSRLDGSVSLINIVVSPKDMDGWYCHYLFRSNSYIEEFYRMGRGIVADLWTTRWSEMRTIMLPIPPLSEQEQIVAYIKEKVDSIDSQIASVEKQIANLNEFKQSLISDAVTGKIKVA